MHRAAPIARVPVAVQALSVVLMLFWLSDIAWQASTRQAGCWTPTHILLYTTGFILGLASLWAVLSKRKSPSAAAGRLSEPRDLVRAHWSNAGLAAVLLATVPFDCLWHRADPTAAGALTPPHIVHAAVVLALQVSIWILGNSLQQLDPRPGRRGIRLGPLLSAGMVLLWFWTMALEYVGWANLWHGSEFYVVSGALFPIWLVAVARSASSRWSATAAAAIYFSSVLITIWIVQSVPVGTSANANPPAAVTTMVPPPFPLLLILPALAIDMVIRRFDRGAGAARELVLATAIGLLFLASFLLIHWPLSDFLLSPLARNYAFAADRWPQGTTAGGWRYEYWNLDAGLRAFVRGMALASLASAVSAFLGLRLGAWLSKRAETR